TARQFDHGLRFVQFVSGKEFFAGRAETSLRGLQYLGIGFAPSSHVQQSEEETGRAGPEEIVKIASRARGKICDRHIRALKHGAFSLDDFGNLFHLGAERKLGKQRLHEGRNLTQTLRRGNERWVPVPKFDDRVEAGLCPAWTG